VHIEFTMSQFQESGFVRVLIIKAHYSLLQILHKNYQIYVGLWYEHCLSIHASDTVSDLHHGQPSSIHCPAHVYLLRVPFPAKWTIMGITCILPSSEMPISPTAKVVHCQYWVLAYSKSTKHHNKALTSSKKTHTQEANHHGIYSQLREQRSQWQGTPTIQQTQLLPLLQYPPASTLST
jgi:hypothetical protein